MNDPTVSPILLRRMIDGLGQLGVDTAKVRQRVGLDPYLAMDASSRIPDTLVRQTWDAVVEVTGRRGWGIRLAALLEPAMWDVFGHLLKSSATLADAAVRAGRYMQLLSDGVELSLHVEGARAMLTTRRRSAGMGHPESVELVLALFGLGPRQVTEKNLQALEVRFVHSAPKTSFDYAQAFGAPVHFDRPHNAIVFLSENLQAPIRSSDARLCAMLERQAKEMIGSIPRGRTLTRRVQDMIAAELHGGNPSADHVADRLGLHPRTLGRHLRKEGTTYQELLDTLRHDLADRYLSESNMSIGEVASMLGYANTSAFNKAFRRWTGTAPHEYRRRMAAAS